MCPGDSIAKNVGTSDGDRSVNEPPQEGGGDLNNACPMGPPVVHALLLEDSAIDADLLESHLVRSGCGLILRRAPAGKTTWTQCRQVGSRSSWPTTRCRMFDGLTALQIAKDRYPDVPFIFVSGVVGEEFATDALKQGAIDYVLKRNLMRLPAAVDRALAEARERRERRRAETALLESDVRLRLAVSSAAGSAPGTMRPIVMRWSGGPADAEEQRTTYEAFMARIHPVDRARMEPAMRLAMTEGQHGAFTAEYRLQQRDGSIRWMAARGPMLFPRRKMLPLRRRDPGHHRSQNSRNHAAAAKSPAGPRGTATAPASATASGRCPAT